jgi:hypothetical protein
MDFEQVTQILESDKESTPTDCMDFAKVSQIERTMMSPTDCMGFEKVTRILENGKKSAPTVCLDF